MNDKMKLMQAYDVAKNQVISNTFNKLKMELFCKNYSKNTDWAVGPFAKDDSFTYIKTKQMPDPTEIGWKSSFIFNPSLIVENDILYLFYRAGVKKESLCSRIGLAIYTDKTGWQDSESNPLIYPTELDEVLSIDDPKVYKANGLYYMFYNGVYYPDHFTASKYGKSEQDVCVNIKCAVSSDKLHWTKKGVVVPLEVSRLWAKGAVIPRDGQGNAVKINGKYLMFLSEGCGGKQVVGFSDDLLQWEFKEIEYLRLPNDAGSQINEVACCIVIDECQFVLDFFYNDNAGDYKAGQALYCITEPFKQIDFHVGGSLAWGGLSQYKGQWIFPQGWDSPLYKEEMYFYTCPIKKK